MRKNSQQIRIGKFYGVKNTKGKFTAEVEPNRLRTRMHTELPRPDS